MPLDRNTWERIDAPKFSGEVHQVTGLSGANVQDQHGKSYPVRQVLAVPGTSTDIDLPDELMLGSGKRKEQLQKLKPFSEALKAELYNLPGGEMSFARATKFLQARPGFSDTADVYRLPKAGRYVKFLRLFGFEIRVSGPGVTVVRPTGAAEGAAPRGRPGGAVDIAPRRPCRVMAASTALLWTPDNPYRGGTAARARYELYKAATTVGEARTWGRLPRISREG